MKRATLLVVSVLSLGQAYAGFGDWWGDDDVDEPPPPIVKPFDREKVEPYVRRFFDVQEYNARTTVYDFGLRKSHGEFGRAMVGEDANLGVKVSLELCGDSCKPVHCVVNDGANEYFSTDIWFTMINNKKKIYLISFDKCDTTLVVYMAKDSAATAQWALLRE